VSAPSAACRSFEEALVRHFDAVGPDATVPETPGHADGCADCRTLTDCLIAVRETLRGLAPPRTPTRLLSAVRALPSDSSARREGATVLDLLTPGLLALPEPSPELMARLRFLPTREREEGRAKALPAWRRWLGDWRVTVAAAYAVTLIVVTMLGVDPLSAARGAASNLTAAGERALEEARATALATFDATARAETEKPLTERLDYRLYRTLASGRARAVAYAEIAFEKVFGAGPAMASAPAGSQSPPDAPGRLPEPQRRPPATPTAEPNGRVLRS